MMIRVNIFFDISPLRYLFISLLYILLHNRITFLLYSYTLSFHLRSYFHSKCFILISLVLLSIFFPYLSFHRLSSYSPDPLFFYNYPIPCVSCSSIKIFLSPLFLFLLVFFLSPPYISTILYLCSPTSYPINLYPLFYYLHFFYL